MRNVLKLKLGNILISEQKMAHYMTKGRRQILAFLEKNQDKQLTAEDVFVALGKDAPGQSSVYRILSSLADDGAVRRERRENGEGVLYQYAENLGCDEHFHLKCTECGKVVHLRCDLIDDLARHILTDHGFIVDKGRSVIYGKCEKCGGKL